MAIMYPREPRSTTTSAAERDLFARLEKDLADDFHVFHSVSWQLPSSFGVEDGETDFIVAHPKLGALVLEVKGGPVRYHGEVDRWYSGEHKIKDPLEQAKRSKYSLLDMLKSDPKHRDDWIPLGHAVAFPDISVDRDLKPDLPRILVLDSGNLQNLEQWIKDAFQYWSNQVGAAKAPGGPFIRRLTSLLAPSWDFKPRLADQFQREDEVIEQLTEEQSDLLNIINRQRRVAIAGCAGSGKTVLAIEKAIRLSDAGFDVLLVCFNQMLAEYLSQTLESNSRMQTSTFHSLCAWLCNDAGIQLPPERNDLYFSEVLPQFAIEAIDKLGPIFDAVIVDEGQDFAEDWWLVLDALLRNGKNDCFYIFFDDNQMIYQERIAFPMEIARITLHRNLRNTQKIHAFATRYYKSEISPVAAGPPGREIDIILYSESSELHDGLRRALYQIVNEEKVKASDVMILTPWGRVRSELWNLAPYGNFDLVSEQSGGGMEIFCTTIQSFKGLESPVVILAELDGRQGGSFQDLLYVGSSRARNHLVLIANREFAQSF